MSKWIDADSFLKEYCEPYPHVIIFDSYNEAGKHYGISPMTVKSCCERKSKGKVRTFRYADGEREGE